MKIVELLIDELEEFMGFDAVALVNQPAHEGNFFAFKDNDVTDAIAFQIIKNEVLKNVSEQFVNKIPGESKDEYISRCIPVIINEGYDQDQAAAICYSDWQSFDETKDPQEIIIGDYQTRHYDMCPGASALYRRIESGELDVDMGIAIRAAKLQDALFWLEKHTLLQMKHASFDDVKAAEILASEIMLLARMMGLEQEHQYVLGHVQVIRELYQQGLEEEMELDPSSLPDFVDELKDKKKVEFEEGIPHYTKDGKLWVGPTHKDADGRLMTGATHTEDSEYLYHLEELQKIKFESYTDYPKQASENAKIALRYAEENGWGDCATPVGKARANQLAKGEPISEETIARMASFARHRENGQRELGDGCGRLSWLAWGGDAGVDWAIRKLDSIREEQSKTKFSFSLQEDQQIVVGPLMIPNKLIFRVDENGEPYYVYFTTQTIEKIARKMMREEKLDDINLEHSQDSMIDGYMLETWLIEHPEKDKQQVYSMNYPKGTWMGMYKVDDSSIWQKVKKGELKGFSVEGYFADKLIQN